MNRNQAQFNTTTSGLATVIGTTSTASLRTVVVGSAQKSASPIDDNIKTAVFGHLQALKVLGRSSAASSEIAEALGLPVRAVDQALRDLQDKGVKIRK